MAYDKVVDSAKLEAGLTSIADKIRHYADTGGPPRGRQFPDGFVQGITDVYNTAVDAAQQDIHDAFHQGLDEGHAAGISAGKQAEYDRFWDAFQLSGEKKSYVYAFYGAGWTDENFRPKYDIKPTEFSQTFNACGVKDLATILTDCGVVLDTSGAKGLSYSFFNSQITHLPVISTVSAGELDNTFHNSKKLKTIEKLILKEDGSQTFTYAFLYCYALEDIVIEGTIGSNPSFGSCSNLSHDSLMSIINHLKDYSGTDTTKTLSLGAANLNRVSKAERQIATDKGWSLV